MGHTPVVEIMETPKKETSNPLPRYWWVGCLGAIILVIVLLPILFILMLSATSYDPKERALSVVESHLSILQATPSDLELFPIPQDCAKFLRDKLQRYNGQYTLEPLSILDADHPDYAFPSPLGNAMALIVVEFPDKSSRGMFLYNYGWESCESPPYR